jgi:hypothetical protein
VLHLWRAGTPRWRDHPLIEFAAWATATPAFIAAWLWLGPLHRPDAWDQGIAGFIPFAAALFLYVGAVFLYVGAIVVAGIGLLFALLLGTEPVSLAVDIGRGVVKFLTQRMADAAFRRLALTMLVPAAVGGLFLWWREAMDVPDWWQQPVEYWVVLIACSPPLFVAGWTLRRRLADAWTTDAARFAAALTVGWTVWIAALLVAEFSRGQDFFGWALSAPGVIPPGTLFVALTAYNVMTAGARFANREGRLAPRTGGDGAPQPPRPAGNRPGTPGGWREDFAILVNFISRSKSGSSGYAPKTLSSCEMAPGGATV